MKKTDLKLIIKQIRKYKLESCFKDSNEFEKWISNLNDTQIKNLINLDVNPGDILFPTKILIYNF